MKNINQFKEENLVKLDLKDKKLLSVLDFDARLPYSRLAKKIGLSKQGAEYKLNNLLKKGVIKGFYPVINVPKLGYLYCRLSLTLQNVTREKYQEIVNYLLNHKKVFWLFEMQGIFDIFLAMWVQSLTEFKDFIMEVENRFGEHIKKKVENLATDVIHFQHRYLLGNKNTDEIHIKETAERIALDELDKDILKILCTDARIPLVDIAKQVRESAKVVAYRIKKLEKKKLIECYRPIVDHNKIGFTYYKLFISFNRISRNDLMRLKEYIKNNPLLIYIIEGIGLHADLDIEMMVSSNQQLFDFIEDLKFRFPALIGEYQTVIFMDTLKVKYLPF
ncbi:MAG: Lrp/AsnC family transcriptional regulator [Nanoarchaeota archaeon]